MMKYINKFMEWLRASVPVTPADKTQHQNLMEIFVIPAACWGLFFPVTCFWIIIGLNVLAIVWELPFLIREKFKYWAIKLSIADYIISFKVSFIPLLMLYYIINY